jgi:hypothetical protein
MKMSNLYALIGAPPMFKIKNSFRFMFFMSTNPDYKILANLKTFLKIQFFYPKGDQWFEKIEISKKSQNWLKFSIRGFVDMENTNLKEFFDYSAYTLT